MKNLLKSIRSLALVLTLGTAALSAQSVAAAGHVSNAAVNSAAASGETLSAVGDSAAGSVKVVAGVAAVPVWMSGAVVASGGAVVSSVGTAGNQAGVAITKTAGKLWDFASGDPSQRPHLNRDRAVPPLKKTEAKPADRSPAETLKTKL